MNWLTDNKIPIGDWAEAVFDWLQSNGEWAFDGLADAMEWLIDAILWLLQTPHPLIVVAVFAALAWALQRSLKIAAFVVLGFLFILNQGYWEETTESLTLVLSACVVCMGVGVPIGIATAHRPRLFQAMRPVLDLMQTLPTFVYLIPAIVFFGIGFVLELFAFAALLNRRLMALFGIGLIGLHVMVSHFMQLGFFFNKFALLIVFVNVPFWLVAAIRCRRTP